MPKETSTPGAAPDGAACWLCGRTSTEVGSALSGDTEDEARIAREIAATTSARDALASNSVKWREGVQESFKDFDLAFVLQNADQFRSMQFLSQMMEEGRRTIRELDEVSYAVRKGAPILIGGIAIDESHRAPIADRLNDFERRTGRKLKREQDLRDVEYQRLGFIARLSGLKLAEGIDFLREAGALYYGLLLDASEAAKARAAERRPVWRLRALRFRDFPREVYVCTVCEALLAELTGGAGRRGQGADHPRAPGERVGQ